MAKKPIAHTRIATHPTPHEAPHRPPRKARTPTYNFFSTTQSMTTNSQTTSSSTRRRKSLTRSASTWYRRKIIYWTWQQKPPHQQQQFWTYLNKSRIWKISSTTASHDLRTTSTTASNDGTPPYHCPLHQHHFNKCAINRTTRHHRTHAHKSPRLTENCSLKKETEHIC